MLIVENMNSIKKEIKISYNLTIQMAPFTIIFLLYFHLVMSMCVCYKIICINKIYHIINMHINVALICILICIHMIACFVSISFAYTDIL